MNPADALEIHPAALDEADADVLFYAGRSFNVALRFLDAIDAAVDSVTRFPETWPFYLHGTRRYVMPDFPYGVVYKNWGDLLIIYAFAHDKRRPGYWKSRLNWVPRA